MCNCEPHSSIGAGEPGPIGLFWASPSHQTPDAMIGIGLPILSVRAAMVRL